MPHRYRFPIGLTRLLLLLLFVASAGQARAQAPAWQAPAAISPLTNDTFSEVTATAADASGNVYIAGLFSGTIGLGTTTLTSVPGSTNGGMSASTDLFVAKWSSLSRTFVWAQRAGNAGAEEATAVAVVGNNVYVAGNFSSLTVGFGSATLTNSNPFKANWPNIFVAKLTDAGATASFTWARSADAGAATEMVVNGANIYVGGPTDLPATFGSITLPRTQLNPSVYLAKLTDAGATASFTWALEAASATGLVGLTALAVSGPNLYWAGRYVGTVAVGSTSFTSVTSNHEDVVVAKVTDAGTSGSPTWAQTAGGSLNEFVYSLAVNGPAVYMAGSLSRGNALFGGLGPVTGAGLASYVAKLTDAGASSSFTWVRSIPASDFTKATALAVNGSKVYVAGTYAGSATFDNTVLTSVGYDDLYVAQLNDAGATSSFAWVQSAGGPSNERCDALAVQGERLYLAGGAGLRTQFGPYQLAGSLTSYTGFVVPLGEAVPTATTGPAVAPDLGLYPNPARTTVQIPAATAATSLRLLDNLGRTVRQGRGSTLSVRGVVPGLYVLQAATPGQPVRTARLVVE